MFLEISQNSQENNHAGVSFLIKLQALACSFIKKETLSQVFSCEFCETSENAFSNIPVACFWRGDLIFTEREREIYIFKEYGCGQKQYSTTMWLSRRDHSIDVLDNIYGCLSGLSCRFFFKIMNFSDRFRQCFKLFYSFEK